MSGAVIALPTAARTPVAQHRRGGRLPSTVKSIGAYRRERQQKQEALLAKYSAQTKSLCYGLLTRVLNDEVTGLAIIEERRDGRPGQIYINGKFLDDPGLLEKALYGSAEQVAHHWSEMRES